MNTYTHTLLRMQGPVLQQGMYPMLQPLPSLPQKTTIRCRFRHKGRSRRRSQQKMTSRCVCASLCLCACMAVGDIRLCVSAVSVCLYGCW